MLKLIEKFKANPSDSNRVRLQRYLDSHGMAIVCHPDQAEWLRANMFRF